MKVLLAAIIFLPSAGFCAILPGANAHERIQEALILTEPGGTIELGEGTFELTLPLSLDTDNVTIRGRGMEKTILSFKGQESGGQGLLVTSSGVTLEDFAIIDAKGDALKAKGSVGLTIRRIRTSWSGGPKTENGAYGIYPVQCRDVLIENNVARYASDSGIYVGQSTNVVVRNNLAEGNVAGIEIENSRYVDVYDNIARGNTGGLLIFDLPDLPMRAGGQIRMYRNTIEDNDLPNFAPKGNIVALVPRGTGVLIMSGRNIESFENTISGHRTVNFIVTSFYLSGREIKDPHYYPFPEGIHVHHNKFGKGGWAPDGELGQQISTVGGVPLPDIIWDGAVNPAILVDGKIPPELKLSVHDNGKATFVNLDLLTVMKNPQAARIERDAAAYAAPHKALASATVSNSR